MTVQMPYMSLLRTEFKSDFSALNWGMGQFFKFIFNSSSTFAGLLFKGLINMVFSLGGENDETLGLSSATVTSANLSLSSVSFSS